MNPTEEQQNAIDLACAGGSLKIEAFAGAGKTTTLVEIAKALGPGRKGLYLAFNKAIADDAKNKFPLNVDCRTAHSLAFRAKGIYYKKRLQRINGKTVSEMFHFPNEYCGMKGAAAGAFVLETVARFTQSAHKEISLSNFPIDRLAGITQGGSAAIAKELFPYAKKLWQMMADPAGQCPITHDVYLKLWTLDDPEIKADYILFDEAQDANPALMALVQKQKAQQIWVGDRYQAIYGWRGAVNAMSKIKTDHSCKISQSFRFGQPIADLANAILRKHLNAKVDIRGFDKIQSRIADCRNAGTVLCRTNSVAIDEISRAFEEGKKVAVVGGTQELVSLLFGAVDLMAGRKTTVPDLALFRDWGEVKEYAESDVGQDLSLLVKLVESKNVHRLIDLLKGVQATDEKTADLVVSTAHKAKGREWPSVRLANDFRGPDHKDYNLEDTNLLYVAATRAINVLDAVDCEVVQEILQPGFVAKKQLADKQQKPSKASFTKSISVGMGA